MGVNYVSLGTPVIVTEVAEEYINAESRAATRATKRWSIPRARRLLDNQKLQPLPARLRNLLARARCQLSRLCTFLLGINDTLT